MKLFIDTANVEEICSISIIRTLLTPKDGDRGCFSGGGFGYSL